MADQKVSDLPALNGADVDAADLLYIVDSSAGSAGSKKITVGQYQLAPVSGGTANGVAYLNGSKALTTGSALVFDGTNLGIGTSSPVAKLTVNGNQSFSNTTYQIGYALNTETGTVAGANSPFYGLNMATFTGFSGNGIGLHGYYGLLFSTAGIERMTLDSSGNLGLGVTPSAWNAFWKNIEVTSASFGGSGAIVNYATMASNIFSDGASYLSNAKYIASGTATAYIQNAGAHQWHTAPSGTAGNAINFTQAMTLDASGNLGIGISTPQAVLHVNKATTSTFRLSATNVGIDIQSLDGAGYGLVSTYTNHPLVFSTNANERARITSDGDLLVGTMTLAGAGGFSFQSQGGTGFAAINNNNAGATGYVFSSYRRSSVEIGSITQNGTTAVLFNTTSDRRLKDNIVPAPSASAVIDAIEIISHDWKAAPDEHVTYGVIAQDLALVAPQAVLQGDDGDEIGKTWGVDYSKLVPMLIKEIQSLRARVAALESA